MLKTCARYTKISHASFIHHTWEFLIYQPILNSIDKEDNSCLKYFRCPKDNLILDVTTKRRPVKSYTASKKAFHTISLLQNTLCKFTTPDTNSNGDFVHKKLVLSNIRHKKCLILKQY